MSDDHDERYLIQFDHTDASQIRVARDAIQDDRPADRVADLMDRIVNRPDIQTVGHPEEQPSTLTLSAWLDFQRRFPSPLRAPGETIRIETLVDRTDDHPVKDLERMATDSITQSTVWHAPIVEPRSGIDPKLKAEVERKLGDALTAAGARALCQALGETIVDGMREGMESAYTDGSQTYVDVTDYKVVDAERLALGTGTQPAEDGTERDV